MPQEQPSATADTATSISAPDLPSTPERMLRIKSLLQAGARTLFSQQTIFWGVEDSFSDSILHTSC